MPERGVPYFWYVRRVWRYQRGNQNPEIEDGRTTKCSDDKGQTKIYKNHHWYVIIL
jgi:hypothetical protein